MKFIELIAKGIGKVWSFCATVVGISLIAAFVLFIIAVFLPDNITQAIEIFKVFIK